jgi:hypothetical protein
MLFSCYVCAAFLPAPFAFESKVGVASGVMHLLRSRHVWATFGSPEK